MQDSRGQLKALRDFYAHQGRVKCVVCGKHYLTRDKKGWCCSRKCREVLEGQPSEPLGGPRPGGVAP
jgi:hypothetical protein